MPTGIDRRDWVRMLTIAGLAVWVGGLTFYAAVVVPLGAAEFGSTPQGFLTQQVTRQINLIGWPVLAVAACNARRQAHRFVWGTWCALLAIELLLVALHPILDGMLVHEGFEITRPELFYQIHRAYLILTTLQILGGFWHLGLLCGRDRSA